MRKKRFNKKMIMMMAPALACTLATGVQNAGADTIPPIVFGAGHYSFYDAAITNPKPPVNEDAAPPITLNGATSATLILEADEDNILDPATLEAANIQVVIVDSGATGITIENHGVIETTLDAGTKTALAAISFSGNFDANSVVTNTGTIESSATNEAHEFTIDGNEIVIAGATGISVHGDLAGVITNSGTSSSIEALARAWDGSSVTAKANGIWVAGSLASTGGLTNEGSISANAEAYEGTSVTARANGIGMAGSLAGDLTNEGSISANAEAYSGSNVTAKANGIWINGGISTGVLLNQGSIEAEAEAYNGSSVTARANGIGMAGPLAGDLTNEGSIHVHSTAYNGYYATALAHGIYVGGAVSSGLTNDGLISAQAQASSGHSITADAYGIRAAGTVSNTLTNSGRIVVEADAYDSTSNADASARGIVVGGALTGHIINEDVDDDIVYRAALEEDNTYYAIDVQASVSAGGEDGEASAIGIKVEGSLDGGTITSNGAIYAEASTEDYDRQEAYAVGISVGDDENEVLTHSGDITNNNVIDVYATATNGSEEVTATAVGLDIQNDFNGVLANNGAIYADAMAQDAPSAEAIAVGMYVGGAVTNELTNEWLINASAKATEATASLAFASGIAVGGEAGGTLENNAYITATATASNASLVTGSMEAISTYSDSGLVQASVVGIMLGEFSTATPVEGTELSGSLANSGHIVVSSHATSFTNDMAYATAAGMYLGDITGSLNNANAISAEASATGESNAYARAYGIYASSVEGTSTLPVSALETSSESDVSLSQYDFALENNGSILVTSEISTESSDGRVFAIGVFAESIGENYVDQSAVALQSSSSNDPFPWYAENGLLNAGLIEAQSTATVADSGYAFAYGVQTETILPDAALINEGTISAISKVNSVVIDADSLEILETTSQYGYAFAYGILNAATSGSYGSMTGGTLSGNLVNLGTIKATATISTDDGSANAYGIYVDSIDSDGMVGNVQWPQEIDGEITWSDATITVRADATDSANGSAYAYGLYAGSVNVSTGSPLSSLQSSSANMVSPSIVNTGTITATARAGASGQAKAYGVYVGELDGTMINLGSITATSSIGGITQPELGYSVFVASGAGTVYNEASSSVEGKLTGNLYLGGTVSLSNSGTIELPAMPGASAPEGAVQPLVSNSNYAYVGGNYTQDAYGTLSLGATSISEYARLAVGDTATFDEGSKIYVNLTQGNTIVIGDTLASVITANELVVEGVDDTAYFTVTDNSALIDFQAVTVGSSELATSHAADVSEANGASTGGVVNLEAIQAYSEEMVGAASWGSGTDAGRAIDEMLGVFGSEDEYEDMHDTLAILRGLETEQEVAEAVVATLPSLRLELARLSLENSHKNVDMTRDRNNVARGMSSGDSVFSDGNLWGGVYGAWANQGSADGAFGYDADTFGVMLGGDIALSPKARIGLGIGFIKSDVDADTLAGQSADVKSYQPTLYGSYAMDEFDVDWHLGYGWHENETTRFVPLAGATAKGDYNSSSVNAGVAVSKNFKMDEKLTLTPSVRLDYAYIDNDSYNETGADVLNLQVGSSDVDELILGVDGKLGYAMNQDWKVNARLGLGYDMMADKDTISAAYAGAPSALYSVYGTEPSSWLYRGGVGVTYGQEDSLQVSLQYNLEGRDEFTNQAVSLKLGLSF